ETRTVAGIAGLLPATTADLERVEQLIVAVPRGLALPLSAAQQRLWVQHDLGSGGTENNTGIGLRLTGTLDVEALRAALDALADRHEALRTTFDEVDGHGVQVIADRGGVPLKLIDLSDVDAVDAVDAVGAVDRDAAVERTLARELSEPFDL